MLCRVHRCLLMLGFLALIPVNSMAEIKLIPEKIPDRKEVEFRLRALELFHSWGDDFETQNKGMFKLDTSPDANDRAMHRFLWEVTQRLKREHQPLELIDVLDWYRDAHTVFQNIEDAQKKVPSREADIGFRLFGPMGIYLEHLENEIRRLENLKTPNLRAVEAHTPADTGRGYRHDWRRPARSASPTSKKMPLDDGRGLVGESAIYAIQVELEAKTNHLADLIAVRDARTTKESDLPAFDSAIKEAQRDLAKFESEVRAAAGNPRQVNALSLFAGSTFDSPVQPSQSYWPYPKTPAPKKHPSKESLFATAQLEREQGLEALRSERSQILQVLSPGYPQMEDRLGELTKKILELDHEIAERGTYTLEKIQTGHRIWPMYNKEIVLWQQLDAIDKRLSGTDKMGTAREIKLTSDLLKDAWPESANHTNSRDKQGWRERKLHLQLLLLATVRGDVALRKEERASELKQLQKEFHPLQDELNQRRLVIHGTEDMPRRLESLEVEIEEAHKNLEAVKSRLKNSESMSAETLKKSGLEIAELRQTIGALETQKRILKEMALTLPSRVELGRKYYHENPNIERYHAGRPTQGPMRLHTTTFLEFCHKTLSRAAALLSL